VPTYEYGCDQCQRIFEVRQRISDPPLTVCDACGGTVRRLLSPAPFILKGGGWYVTDYPSESRKKALDAEKPAAAKGSSDAKSESTPDTKSSTPSPDAPASSAPQSTSSSQSD
jgi:putative FmdB family regulatory protein